MKNMYEILDRMNLLEGKGSKPDFLDLDKDGNKKEPMKSAAKDVDESALQAYLGKKKYGETGMKALQKAGRDGASKERMASIRAKHDKMDEAEMEEGNEFSGELTKARAQGAKSFKVDGKEYPVKEDQIDELDMKLLKGLQGAMSKNQKDSESERNIHKKYGYRSDRDDTGNDDDYDEYGNLKDKKKAKSKDDGPKKKGRPAGTGRKLGAKGPTGKSKLLRMKEDEMISLVDKGEYDREGDMAREQLHTAAEAAKELHDILDADENLPEWVQSKITKALDYLDTARDYMKASDAEDGEEMPVSEKAVSRQQQKFMGMAHAMQKGEKIKGASPELKKVAKTMKKGDVEDFAKTKHKGLPEKKKKEEAVDETTVAGSVATAPTSGKAAKGMMFGKGVYESQIAESFERKLNMIAEGMSINMSVGEDGTKSLSVNATNEDAEQLAMLLKMAGLGSSAGHKEVCPACGSADCGCEQMSEEYANEPDEETQTTDYMTKTIAGGLNKPKRDVAGNGQTTVPVSAVRVQEEADIESHLTNLYKQFKS
jgi:phage anti-repressor protein